MSESPGPAPPYVPSRADAGRPRNGNSLRGLLFRFIAEFVALPTSPEGVASSPRATPCHAPRHVAVSAPDAAIRLHLMRDPVNRPLAESQRKPAGRLERRDFSRSRIRCSWRLGPLRFRQASPPEDDRDEREGSAPKKIPMAPPLRPHHPPNPTFHAGCPTRNGEALRPASGMPPDDGSTAAAHHHSACLQPQVSPPHSCGANRYTRCPTNPVEGL